MRWGAHLPLADFGDGCGSAAELRNYVSAAWDHGYDMVSVNDHITWHRPWLDGLAALSAVAGCAPDMTLATSVALPAVRHPVVLAKALASLAVLHTGPVVAGIGPGSSRADYAAVGIPFEERWSRFDAAVQVLRALFSGKAHDGLGPEARIAPMPDRAPQLWFGSWGRSAPRLRAIAATADGWYASGYNTDPQHYADTRRRLDAELARAGRDPASFPDAIATMWLYVSHDARDTARIVDMLAPLLNRGPRTLADHLPIGGPDHRIEVLTAYAEAGARRVMLWPILDGIRTSLVNREVPAGAA